MDLFLPRRCAGCDEAGELLCASCRQALRRAPQRVFVPVDPHVPVWSLGPYAEAHRKVILSMKERNNLHVRAMLGPVLAAAIAYLQVRGELPERVGAPILVPAPTREASARLRGGDHVTDVCRASGLPFSVALRHRASVRDQVGLDAAQRRQNLVGSIQLRQVPSAPVVLIDDVVTTGSTLATSCEVLTAAGCQVLGAVVIAHA